MRVVFLGTFCNFLRMVCRGQCLQFLRVIRALDVYLKAGHIAFATWLTTASWSVVQFEFKGTNPAVVRYSFDSKGGRPTVRYREWEGAGCSVSCVVVPHIPQTMHQPYVPAHRLSVYFYFKLFDINYELLFTAEDWSSSFNVEIYTDRFCFVATEWRATRPMFPNHGSAKHRQCFRENRGINTYRFRNTSKLSKALNYFLQCKLTYVYATSFRIHFLDNNLTVIELLSPLYQIFWLVNPLAYYFL